MLIIISIRWWICYPWYRRPTFGLPPIFAWPKVKFSIFQDSPIYLGNVVQYCMHAGMAGNCVPDHVVNATVQQQPIVDRAHANVGLKRCFSVKEMCFRTRGVGGSLRRPLTIFKGNRLFFLQIFKKMFENFNMFIFWWGAFPPFSLAKNRNIIISLYALDKDRKMKINGRHQWVRGDCYCYLPVCASRVCPVVAPHGPWCRPRWGKMFATKKIK